MQAFGTGLVTRLAGGCFQREFYCEIQLAKHCEMDNNSVLVLGFLKRDMDLHWDNSKKLFPDVGQ